MKITCKQCGAVHIVDFEIDKCMHCGGKIVDPTTSEEKTEDKQVA